MLVLWPICSFIESSRCAAQFSRLKLSKRSSLHLFAWAWALALRKHVRPAEAFAYHLFEPAASDANQWWYTAEVGSLVPSITDAEATRLAHDKRAFADWCRENSLRAIPTLAVLSGEPLPALPVFPRDLLLKPRFGSQGRGIEAWRYHERRFRKQGSTLTLSSSEFALHTVRHAQQHGQILVQPLLSPHPAVAAIARSGMPAVRAITARWPNGSVELGPALLQAPRPDVPISQSGPFRLIDSKRGTLQPMMSTLSALLADASLDAELSRVEVPCWSTLKAMLTKAHALFPGQAPIIGWDVIFDADGPLLCEANVSISYYYFQYASAQPMAKTILGSVLEAWVTCLA